MTTFFTFKSKTILKGGLLASCVFASMAAYAATVVSTALTTIVTDNDVSFTPTSVGSITTTGGVSAINAIAAASSTISVNTTLAVTEILATSPTSAAINIGSLVTGSTLTIDLGAVVQSVNNHGVLMANNGGTFTFTNNGTLTSSGTGTFHALNFTATAVANVPTITNNGTISTTSSAGNAINSGLTAAGMVLTNGVSGVITGNVVMSGAGPTNTLNILGGTITGNVSGGGGINTNISATFTTGGTMGLGAGALAITGTAAIPTTFTVANAITSTGTNSFGTNTKTCFNATSAIGGTKTINGTVFVTAGVGTNTVTGGDITGNATGIFQPSLRGSNATLGVGVGQLWGGLVTLNDGFLIAPQLAGNGYYSNNTTFTVIKGTGITLDHALITQPSSVSVGFTKAISGNDIVLTVVRTPYDRVVADGNAKAVGVVLESLGPTVNSDLGLIVGQLEKQGSAAALSAALSRLAPDVDGAVMCSTFAIQTQGLGTAANRLETIRSGLEGYDYNYASGDMSSGRGGWVQVFGNFGIQQTRTNIIGYKADTFGLGAGVDTLLSPTTRAGVGLSVATASVHSRHSVPNILDVDNRQVNFYGTQDVDEQTYVEGMLSFGQNKYQGKRRISVGSISRTALSEYPGTVFAARLGAGRKIPSGLWEMVPSMGYQFSHLRVRSYTETQADAANLAVQSTAMSASKVNAGFKLRYLHETMRGKVVPELRFMIVYDFLAEVHSTTSRFIQDGVQYGDPFVVQGASIPKTTYTAGFGWGIYTLADMKIHAAYDYEARKDYHTHSAAVNFRYEW